jgi:hypothetical protein
MHDDLHQGADALKALMQTLGAISNLTLSPETEADTRDYACMTRLVHRALTLNLHHQNPNHVQGFIRAMTDLLCINADGCGVTLGKWDPIDDTAHSFEGGESVVEATNHG